MLLTGGFENGSDGRLAETNGVIDCGQSFENRMVKCGIKLVGSDVVFRHYYREVLHDRCPMQRMVDVFPLIFCGNGSSVLHPGAIREFDNAGEEGRIVDGCVFSEVPRLVVGDHAGEIE